MAIISQKGRKKTPQDYHDLAQERGIEWIGEFPKDTHTKTLWRCGEGHEWLSTYSVVYSGSTCKQCSADKQRLSESDYHELAESKGFVWLGDVIKNARTATLWGCDNGHEWMAKQSDIKQGKGCPHCAGNAPKIIADYHRLASEKGFQWLGKELPLNVHSKTLWECAEGHIWEALYANVRHGYGCPHCAGNIAKTKEDYVKIAEKFGYQWIGDEIISVNANTQWQCLCGCQWETTYGSIRQGHGCPRCAGKERKTEADYYDLAQEIDLQWVGELPQGVHDKTLWICEKGHEWRSSYTNVRIVRSCPRCKNMFNGAQASKPQIAIGEWVKGEINQYVEGFCIDVFIEIKGQGVCIEYDGWYWHKNRLDLDAERDQKLIEAGYKVLRIRSNELLPEPNMVYEAIERLMSVSQYEEITLPDWGEG